MKWVPDMALDVSSSVTHDGKVKYVQSQAIVRYEEGPTRRDTGILMVNQSHGCQDKT